MHTANSLFFLSVVAPSIAGVVQLDDWNTDAGVHIVTNTRTVYTTICPVTPTCPPVGPASETPVFLSIPGNDASAWQAYSSSAPSTFPYYGPGTSPVPPAREPASSSVIPGYGDSSSQATPVSLSPSLPSSSAFPECWTACFATVGVKGEVYLCDNQAVSSCICDTCNQADDQAYKSWLVDFCASTPGSSSSSSVSSAWPISASSSTSAAPGYGSTSSSAPIKPSRSSSIPPSSSSGAGPRPSCPAVWSQIVDEMKQVFGGCTEPARQSIRFAFHDAAGFSSLTTPYGPASGGADGSLLLSDEEVARSGNAPLPQAQQQIKAQWVRYQNRSISAADFVQMSGLIAVRSCGGPAYKMLVGREDDSTPCPEGTLPAAFGANSSYSVLTQLWAEKGIDERELAALIGAHTVSRAFAQQANGVPPASPQDTSFTQWDNRYFRETQATNAPSGVFRFTSDTNLAMANTTAGQAFTEFGNDFNAWNIAYSAAAYKLSLLGVGQAKIDSMADCSALAL